jgi:hypothetical protein
VRDEALPAPGAPHSRYAKSAGCHGVLEETVVAAK